jgi:hypothetical protein
VIQEINSDPTVTDTSQLRSSRYAVLSNSFADNKNEGDLNVTSKESHGTKMVSNKGKNVATNSDYGGKKNNIHGPFRGQVSEIERNYGLRALENNPLSNLGYTADRPLLRGKFKSPIGPRNIYQLRCENESLGNTSAMAVSINPNDLSHASSAMSSHSQCELRRGDRSPLPPHCDDMANDESDPVLIQRVMDESKDTEPPDNVVLMEEDNFGEKEDVVSNTCNVLEEEKMVEDKAPQLIRG